MPQLDLFSYFSAASSLVFGFLFLVFVLHTYFLPKIATALKFRKKILKKSLPSEDNLIKTTADNGSTAILNLAQTYVTEMEKILKAQNKS